MEIGLCFFHLVRMHSSRASSVFCAMLVFEGYSLPEESARNRSVCRQIIQSQSQLMEEILHQPEMYSTFWNYIFDVETNGKYLTTPHVWHQSNGHGVFLRGVPRMDLH